MKKIILSLLLSIYLIGLVSAAGDCSEDPGFDWCYSNRYDKYSPAICYAEVQGSYPKCDGILHDKYCVGNWYVNAKYDGDEFYLQKGVDSWDSSRWECDMVGCPGDTISSGKIMLASGVSQVPKFALAVWDYDEDEGWWCWSAKRAGYLGDYFDLYSVRCYENSDCGTGKYCDKSGTWKDWDCKVADCETGQQKCVGNNLYRCENFKWVDKGLSRGNCGSCLTPDDCGEFPENKKGEWTCENKICVFHESFWSRIANWFKNFFSKWRIV